MEEKDCLPCWCLRTGGRRGPDPGVDRSRSGESEVVLNFEQARDLAHRRACAAGLDAVAGLLRLFGEDGESTDRGDIGEVQLAHMEVYGLGAVELDVFEGGLEIFERGDVSLALEDDPGDVLALDGLDSEVVFVVRVSQESHVRRV